MSNDLAGNTFCTQQFLFTQDLITMKEDLAKLRNENAGLRLELSGLHNAGKEEIQKSRDELKVNVPELHLASEDVRP